MPTYNKAHTDFLNDTFNEDSLKLEIAADENITTELTGITSSEAVDGNGDPTGNYTVTFHFPTELSGDEQTALANLCAAHTGAAPMLVTWHASSVLCESQKTVTDTDPDWTELGGSVTTPSFFTPNVAACKARVVGLYKTNGANAKIRIREDDSAPSGDITLDDTSGQWSTMQWFSPDAPSAGTHKYTLEGQLPSSGATELAVKYVAVSLLEFS